MNWPPPSHGWNWGLSIFEQRLKGEDRERLLDIAEEVRHMSNLINELLSFTRAEIGRSEAPQTVSLKPMILEAMAREAKAGVEMVNHVSDDISVWVVPSLFRRAVSNVLRNAVRYAGPEGPIEIMAEKQGNKVFVAVKDRGPGVPETSIQRLFEPFYRPEAARNRKSGGRGPGARHCQDLRSGLRRHGPRGKLLSQRVFRHPGTLRRKTLNTFF